MIIFLFSWIEFLKSWLSLQSLKSMLCRDGIQQRLLWCASSWTEFIKTVVNNPDQAKFGPLVILFKTKCTALNRWWLLHRDIEKGLLKFGGAFDTVWRTEDDIKKKRIPFSDIIGVVLSIFSMLEADYFLFSLLFKITAMMKTLLSIEFMSHK